jgi:NADPH:quinone reductase-like Zn-dependent oxidoreductase
MSEAAIEGRTVPSPMMQSSGRADERDTMKAIVYGRYGPPDVLKLQEIKKPFPRADEVLVRVCATTVTAGDVRMRGFDVPRGERLFARLYLGVRRPRRSILGMELAGEIESVGKDVRRFKEGDQVFASTVETDFGGYAEYKCFPEDAMMAIKPANMTFQEAAAVPVGGATALRFLRKAKVRDGRKVMIYGASGSVGTFAVQLAKGFGAEVTGVCSHANLGWVKALGADEVFDYAKEDLHQSGRTFDVVFDAVGKISRERFERSLKEKGAFHSVMESSGKERIDDLRYLKYLIEAGKLRSVIDRRYPLERIAEAHRYVGQGHKKGNVVITVDHCQSSSPVEVFLPPLNTSSPSRDG